MKITRNFLLCALFSAVLWVSPAAAQFDNGTFDFINGETYTCYFLSSLDIVGTEIQFGNDVGINLKLSRFPGSGFYTTILESFYGVYWSLDQTVGGRRGDLLFVLLGNANPPYDFIRGAGVIVLEYKEVFPLFFFGFRAIR